MYPDQHGVDLAALANLIEQDLGHDSVPAFTPVEDGDGNAVARLDVFGRRVRDPDGPARYRVVTRRQAGLQHGPRR